MKFQINRRLLPVKAHYFFFFAALGPVLPQLNVFGKQLGVSPAVMGVVTALLPPFWAAAKPLFGYIVDFWPHRRKLVFMILIATMTGSYCNLWFIPMPVLPHKDEVRESVHKLNQTVYVRKIDNDSLPYVEKFSCYWNCTQMATFIYNNMYLTNTTYVNALYINQAVNNTTCSFLHMEFSEVREGETVCRPKDGCNLMCFEDGVHFDGEIGTERRKRSANDTEDFYDELILRGDKELKKLLGTVQTQELLEDNTKDFYMSPGFWVFVILMCVGTVAFNVANCIGDAVCFDVLGAEGSKYGLQRAWGTAGYGLTALLGGWLVDRVSYGQKDFTPAFIICLVATVIDLFSCRALTLPPLTSPDDGGKALKQVLRIPRVLVFITFAVVAGTLDSFIIYYMFWYLEEIAEVTGHTGQIKLIEGVVVAAQSFVGELLFFYLSGKIIKRWGYGATMTLSLFCYGVRMLLISLVKHPWHFVFIEGIMQGPTYALCYSTIVGYAAHVAPEGYSATVQGVVAGMDDGVGFALGSLVGGQLYSHLGGQISFIIFSVVAVVAAGLHAVLFALVTRDNKAPSEKIEEPQETILLEVHRKKDKRERLDRHRHIDERQHIDKYRRREERHSRGETGQRIDKRRSRERGIYRDTVEPLMQGRELKPVSVSYKR